MKFSEFQREIEGMYSKRFGKSACRCAVFNCAGKSITIDCLLAADRGECPHGITSNDMFSISLFVEPPRGWNDSDELPENLTIRAVNNSIKTKPAVSYMYCDYRKIPFRKTMGNTEKMLQTFGKFLDRLHSAMVEEYEADNLLPFDTALIRSKQYR